MSTVIRARRQVAGPIGTAALVGQLATARTPLAPDGFVFIQGERWAARLDEGSTDEGGRVRVTGVNGFRLTVHKEDPS